MRIVPGADARSDIYGLTDSDLSLGRDVVTVVRGMLDGGIRVIQYREKRKDKRTMLAECRALRRMTDEAGACLIVNDHVDIALLCKADGIHVGQGDIPCRDVRALVGGAMFIGVSARTIEEARQAADDGADTLGIGPVFETGTKRDAGPALHFRVLDWCLRHSPLPVCAIGGINRATIGDVAAHGCRSMAIVSDLTSAIDIPARVRELRTSMHRRFP